MLLLLKRIFDMATLVILTLCKPPFFYCLHSYKMNSHKLPHCIFVFRTQLYNFITPFSYDKSVIIEHSIDTNTSAHLF